MPPLPLLSRSLLRSTLLRQWPLRTYSTASAVRNSNLSAFRLPRTQLTTPLRRRFFGSSSHPLPPPPGTQQRPQSLSARFKSLSKEYGYSALAVYIGLSCLDFPFCFLAVRMLGTDRIGEWEEAVVGWFKKWYHETGLPPFWSKAKPEELEKDRQDDIERRKKDSEKTASIWTELALAYAIHKSLIFIRVPLTAAVTPKVVRILRGWGWDIGKPGKPTIKMPPRKGKKGEVKEGTKKVDID